MNIFFIHVFVSYVLLHMCIDLPNGCQGNLCTVGPHYNGTHHNEHLSIMNPKNLVMNNIAEIQYRTFHYTEHPLVPKWSLYWGSKYLYLEAFLIRGSTVVYHTFNNEELV